MIPAPEEGIDILFERAIYLRKQELFKKVIIMLFLIINKEKNLYKTYQLREYYHEKESINIVGVVFCFVV